MSAAEAEACPMAAEAEEMAITAAEAEAAAQEAEAEEVLLFL
jgi:hypothetical protein